jgi:hypothetical protein
MSTKTKRGSKYQSYSEILPITSLPIASRRVLAIGRGGNKIKPRKHHLNTAQIDQLKAEFRDSGKIPSPFNKGAYHFTLMALIALGVNRKHPIAEAMAKFKELGSDKDTKNAAGQTFYQYFRDKDAKGSEETSLDWQDRFEQNIRVLQRFGGMNPYGYKLNQVGTQVCRYKGLVIDLLKGKDGEVFVRLNTEANRPVNELKTRNVQPVKVARKVVKRKARKAAAVATPAADAPAVENTAPAAEQTDTATTTA